MNDDYPNNMYAKLSPEDAFDLWVLLAHAQYAISRSRDIELAPWGISPEQASILHTLLHSGGETTITEIAKFTMHRHHSVSNLIKKMSERGLVQKIKRPKSKEFKIVLTENGRQLCDKVTRTSVEMIFAPLPVEDRRELAKSLKQLLVEARRLLGMDYKPLFYGSRQ
jgi:DNA-binding MarR family transcriptional regulator